MTAYYAPDSEHSIRWDDPQLGVDWPLDGMEPVISERDLSALPLVDAMVFE
jgi:dTDP-4-dehydrorhamnose 3,5-epimerase